VNAGARGVRLAVRAVALRARPVDLHIAGRDVQLACQGEPEQRRPSDEPSSVGDRSERSCPGPLGGVEQGGVLGTAVAGVADQHRAAVGRRLGVTCTLHPSTPVR
jgi:hypothetical protein